MSMKIIWDGLNFLQVTIEEAKRLIAEDKAEDETIHGNSHFRYRHQFTGYKTREMRAEKPIAPAPEEDKEVDLTEWRSYRKEVGEAIGKPTMKVKKADVEAYLHGDI